MSGGLDPWRRGGHFAAIAVGGVLFATCLATGLAAGEDASSGPVEGPGEARSGPPTAAEAASWEAEFLAREGQTLRAPPTPPGKRALRNLFPQNRVVSVYGAANGFGVVGRKSVNGAAKKLSKQAKPYRRLSRDPVIRAFDLVAVIATSCSGPTDKCRVRVSDNTIQTYLNKIRKLNGRLILDIQPARSNVMKEIDHLREFIRKPDVDVAIDAEWNVGRNGIPGQTQGSIGAKKLNEASLEIQSIIRKRDLPQKLMIVHQFHEGSIKKGRDVKRRDDVDVTFNFDGIGSRAAKKAAYRQLRTKRLFNGFSLFYNLDDNLMRPRGVMRPKPKPDYVMYQ